MKMSNIWNAHGTAHITLWGIFTTAAHLAVVVLESKSCLIDLPTFSYSLTRATRDIDVEDDDLKEVKTV